MEKAKSSEKDNKSQNEVTANTLNANKRSKVYPVPKRDEFDFEITIKILQTNRQHRNKLTLSRDVLDTIIGRVNHFEFIKDNTNVLTLEKENCDGEYYITAIGLLNLLCYHVLSMYDKVNNNTNTSGIWDVSNNDTFQTCFIILLQ